MGDEQFCPTCGTWIDPLRPREPEAEFEEFELGDEPVEGASAGQIRVPRAEVQCPSCGAPNPASNRHCEECGARLSQGTLPVAPRPAVQTTAGVRAAMGISAVLLVVIVAVALVNLFGDDGGAAPETTQLAATTSTTQPPEAGPLDPLDVRCSVEGLAGFSCDNLIDGGDGEYQINWEELEPGQPVTITFTFSEATQIANIVWENLEEGDRFFQNYRVRSVNITDGGGVPIPTPLEDTPGTQIVQFVSPRTFELAIEITDVYDAQERNDQIFSELAIREIQVLGRPAADAGTQTDTTPTTAG